MKTNFGVYLGSAKFIRLQMWEMFFSNIDFFLLHERKEEKQTTKTKELLPNKSYTQAST
jgi:hypothetical protein